MIRRRAAGAAVLLLYALGANVSAAEGEIPTPAELEALGAVIGNVTITASDIFDTRIEGEDGWLYRTANRLHIKTRPAVIRDQLLFKPGDPYVHRLLQESERILRDRGYLYDAVISAVGWDGRAVDLEVHTRDVWTLNPGVSFSRTPR